MVQVVRRAGPEPGLLHIPHKRVEQLGRQHRRPRLVHGGGLRQATQPAGLADGGHHSIEAGRRSAAGLEAHLAEARDIRVHPGDGLFKVLLVVLHVVPLAELVLVGRVQRAVDEGQEARPAALDGVERHAEVDERLDGVRVLRRDGRGHARAPVVADPDRGVAACVAQQGHHARDDGLLAVVVGDAAGGRLPVPRHVGGDDAEAHGCEGFDRGLPGDGCGGPAMDEDDQGADGRACGEVVDGFFVGVGDTVVGDGHHDAGCEIGGEIGSLFTFFIAGGGV
ncbi:predicted protein [Aspergillus terreus NIH2624]|uniref:Uncharacterized protein n=1 Tax=Aspergillus terreus (strain NIH 2624 / FGSC A1156) TaxID=341663 RepID=Q0CVF8_ASPTN|nr:uncharacterized protein ATEG_02326 [Aspergillus terreus NIH2624]EAU37288.1 predicted protein [Aspergillus terreus NIH2624]